MNPTLTKAGRSGFLHGRLAVAANLVDIVSDPEDTGIQLVREAARDAGQTYLEQLPDVDQLSTRARAAIIMVFCHGFVIGAVDAVIERNKQRATS